MKIDRHFLVRCLGFRGAMLHGDPMVADRWRFLRRWLPKVRDGQTLMDVGCGSGTFTIGAARRGYQAIGLSWDEKNQRTATERSAICGVPHTRFPVQDARRLDESRELREAFDVIVNFENIEHILDDRKLMLDMASCLRPGGWLIQTAPYYLFNPITALEIGPFSKTEDGGHVRRGYTAAMLKELCADAGLIIEEISSCSGFISQKLTWLLRVGGTPAWFLSLPLRVLPRLLDPSIKWLTGYRDYSICLVAYKPRFGTRCGTPVELHRSG